MGQACGPHAPQAVPSPHLIALFDLFYGDSPAIRRDLCPRHKTVHLVIMGAGREQEQFVFPLPKPRRFLREIDPMVLDEKFGVLRPERLVLRLVLQRSDENSFALEERHRHRALHRFFHPDVRRLVLRCKPLGEIDVLGTLETDSLRMDEDQPGRFEPRGHVPDRRDRVVRARPFRHREVHRDEPPTLLLRDQQ